MSGDKTKIQIDIERFREINGKIVDENKKLQERILYLEVLRVPQWQPTEKERAMLAVIAMDKKMTVNQVISQALRAYQSNEYPLEDQGMLPPQPTEDKT